MEQKDSSIKTFKVKSYIRIRPPLQREIQEGQKLKSCIALKGNTIFATKNLSPIVIEQNSSNPLLEIFNFEKIFDQDSNQEVIFSEIGLKILEKIKEGYNSTLFAYGITGSGKTYTIDGTEYQPGIFPQLLQNLLQIKNLDQEKEWNFELSICQIYNEEIYDLQSLVPDQKLKISVTKSKIFINSITKTSFEDLKTVLKIFESARSRKKVASTKMNEVSSRGHTLYTIYITHTSLDFKEKGNLIFYKKPNAE